MAKKKRKGCGCFLAGVLIVFGLFALTVGGAFVIGNTQMKKHFGISLMQTFKLVGTLYDGDREKIITNAPTKDDEQAFYDALSKTMYLKAGTVNSDTVETLVSALTGNQNTESEQNTRSQNSTSQGGDVTSALSKLIDRDNADFDRLKKFTADYDYYANYDADFKTALTDKQLMSLIKGIANDKMSGNKILQQIALEQMTISRSQDDLPFIGVTASVDVVGLASGILEDAGQIPSFAKNIALKILPEEIFVDLSIVIGEEKNSLTVNINRMDETNHANAMKLLDGILRIAGKNKSGQEFLDEVANDYADKIIDTANDIINLDKSIQSDGKIEFDIFGVLSTMIFKDKDLTSHDLAFTYTNVLNANVDNMLADNEEHFFKDNYLVVDNGVEKVVYSPTPIDNATLVDYRNEFLEEFSAKYLIRTKFYRDGKSASKAYLEPAYKYFNNGEKTILGKPEIEKIMNDVLPIDGQGNPLTTLWGKIEIVDGVAKLVSVSPTKDTTHNREMSLLDFVEFNFDDVTALLGIGKSDKIGNIQMYSLLDASGMSKELYDINGDMSPNKDKWYINSDRENLKLQVTEKMLATLIDSQMNNLFNSGNELVSALEMKWVALTSANESETIQITDNNETPTGETMEVVRKYITIGFLLDTTTLFSGIDFVANAVDDTIGLIAKIEITPNLESKYLTLPAIEYADLGQERTEKLLDVLSKLGMSNLNVATVMEQVAQPVRDAVNTMATTIGGVEILPQKIVTPDIFKVISTQMFAPKEDRTLNGEIIVLSADELHSIMQGLYNMPSADSNASKGYLTNGNGASDGSQYTNVFGQSFYLPSGVTINNLNNNIVGVDRFNRFYELQSDGQLGAYGVSLALPHIDLGQVVGYCDTDEYMFITFEYMLAQYIKDEDSNASLLTFEKIYATFRLDKTKMYDQNGNITTDKSQAKSYDATLIINTMNESDKNSLLEMMVYLADKPQEQESKFRKMEENVGKIGFTIANNEYINEYIASGTIAGFPIE